jgi:hypothetical protein
MVVAACCTWCRGLWDVLRVWVMSSFCCVNINRRTTFGICTRHDCSQSSEWKCIEMRALCCMVCAYMCPPPRILCPLLSVSPKPLASHRDFVSSPCLDISSVIWRAMALRSWNMLQGRRAVYQLKPDGACYLARGFERARDPSHSTLLSGSVQRLVSEAGCHLHGRLVWP